MSENPSKYLMRFFRWFCNPDYVEDIEGDLLERYEVTSKEKGIAYAKWWFFMELVKLMRPSLMKTEVSMHTNVGLFMSHVKTASRSIRRHALFSNINIAGLSVGLSILVFMVLFLKDLYAVDTFHENQADIYQVTSRMESSTLGVTMNMATASNFIAEQIDLQSPQVEEVVTLKKTSLDLIIDHNAINAKGFFTEPSFFDVFSFKLIKGDPQYVLSDPYGIVLTESAAKKLFGDTDPMGQPIEVDNFYLQSGVVTGIAEDPPVNSLIQFEVLASQQALEMHVVKMQKQFGSDSRFFMGDWVSLGFYVFAVIRDSAHIPVVQSTINDIIHTVDANKTLTIQHDMRPYVQVGLSEGLDHQIGNLPFTNHVHYLLLLVVFVVLMACFNYANISLAKSYGRTREIGVRKVIGANKRQVFGQMIIEAVMISFIAMLFGSILFLIFRPYVLDVLGTGSLNYETFQLRFSFKSVVFLVGLSIIVGVFSGILPALMFSRMKSISLFDNLAVKQFSGVNIRYLLITLQFMISVGLMTFSYVVYRQYQYILEYPLGFDPKGVITISIGGGYADKMANELRGLPFVEDLSASMFGVAFEATHDESMAVVEGTTDSIWYTANLVEDHYLQMMDYDLMAGTNVFSPLSYGGYWKETIVNEAFVAGYNLGTPDQAIGKKVLYENQTVKVIGVVGNFVSKSLKKATEPYAFLNHPWPEYLRYLYVKIGTHDRLDALTQIEQIYRRYDEIYPFVALDYADQVARTYTSYQVMFVVIGFLTIVAILMSGLGLFGIAVYTVESHMKEISIRKVLGAKLGHLIVLMVRPSVIMLLVASVLVLPVTIYLVKDKVLNDFAYRIEIGVVDTVIGICVGLVAVMLVMLCQMKWISHRNPADLLRDE